MADICDIPKVSHSNTIETNLCPKSLTPVISKVVEDFVYSWVLHVVKLKLKLHWNQVDALKGLSTVDALAYLLHNMFSATDSI